MSNRRINEGKLRRLMNYQSTLHKVLSDPNFEPPECLLDLDLKGSFEDLLRSCEKKAYIYVKFAIGEAKLVLPIFEAQYPNDDRPKEAILATEKWLKIKTTTYTAEATVEAAAVSARMAAARAADAADRAARAADAAGAALVATAATQAAAYAASNAAGAATVVVTAAAAYAASNAAHAAYYYAARDATDAAINARMADPNITLNDQLRRLFIIIREA